MTHVAYDPEPAEREFTVSWSIDSLDAISPEGAAHEALRTLHETFAGTPESANVFEVFDPANDIYHTIDLGDLDSTVNSRTAIWPRPAGARASARLNWTDAKYLRKPGSDHVTVRVAVDQDEYLAGHAMFLLGFDGDDHFDVCHRQAFTFGVPTDCGAEIVAVRGSSFLVDYTTAISEPGPDDPDEGSDL